MSPGAPKGPSPRVLMAVVSCAVLIPVRMAPAQLQLTRLIGEGDPAPGLPGVEIASVWPPQIDNQGNIATRARLRGEGVGAENDEALLYGRPGEFSLMFRSGDPAPGLEPLIIKLRLAALPGLSLAGPLAYGAAVWDGADQYTTEVAVWSGDPEDMHLVLRGNDPPGIPDPDVRLKQSVDVNTTGPAGHFAFRGWLDGPGIDDYNDDGLWVQENAGGPFQLAARSGGQAPGLDPGVFFASPTLLSSNFPVNAHGQVAFSAFVDGPGVTPDDNQAVWSGRPGELTITVRKGDPAPGAGSGVEFNGFWGMQFNGAGEQYFRAALRGPGVTQDNDISEWIGSAGDLHLLAREGDPAPGAPDGVVFGWLTTAELNEPGTALMLGDLRGPGIDETNDQGIWIGQSGDLDLLLLEDDIPVGVEPGVTFDLEPRFGMLFNDPGDVVLQASLRGPGISDENDNGFWARDHASGEWMLIAREGGVLDGRVIELLGLNHTWDPGGVGLNDQGVFAFVVDFTDGTDAAYSVRVPGPAAAWMLLGGAALVRPKSRRRTA